MIRHTNWNQDFRAHAGPIAAGLVQLYRDDSDTHRETVANLTIKQVDALHKAANGQTRTHLKAYLGDLIETWRADAADYAAVGAPGTIGETYAKCIEGIESVVKQCFE